MTLLFEIWRRVVLTRPLAAAMVAALGSVALAAHWLVSAVLILLGLTTTYVRRAKLKPHSVGFFHPHTSDGGGGERVLWCAVREVQTLRPDAEVVVYTGDDLTGAELTRRAALRFGVTLARPIDVVKLRRRRLVEPDAYPALTLVGQAVGACVLAAEALSMYRPAVFFDTVGHAFAYPLARLAGSRVVAYVHYPTVSSDMIARVRRGAETYNNRPAVARSGALSLAKLWYYRAFALAYGACGRCASAVAVNSSWTKAHVDALWGTSADIVYPPCDVDFDVDVEKNNDATKTRDAETDPPYVLSVGQFRPEKDHALQLRAWARAKEEHPELLASARLKLAGGVRGPADAARVASLRALADAVGVGDSVDFVVDAPHARIRELLANARVGLHAMLDEHFGICVVEYMAAGAVPVAHASAGPKMDIVVPAEGVDRCGFLAETEAEYASAIARAFGLDEAERAAMVERGRNRARRMFSEGAFSSALRGTLAPVFRELETREAKARELRELVAMERASRSPSPRKGVGGTPSPGRRRGTPARGTPTRGTAGEGGRGEPAKSPLKPRELDLTSPLKKTR